MAKQKTGEPARVFADEKLIEQATDFVSRHSGKLIGLFCVIMAGVIIWVVSAYAVKSHEEEVADYLEEHLFSPLGISDFSRPFYLPVSQPEEELPVDEILKRVEGTAIRPLTLWILALYLFQKGGEENLARAKTLAEALRDEYTDPEYEQYQTYAAGLLSKIEEEKGWTPPEPAAIGPPAPAEGVSAEQAPKEPAAATSGPEQAGKKKAAGSPSVPAGKKKPQDQKTAAKTPPEKSTGGKAKEPAGGKAKDREKKQAPEKIPEAPPAKK